MKLPNIQHTVMPEWLPLMQRRELKSDRRPVIPDRKPLPLMQRRELKYEFLLIGAAHTVLPLMQRRELKSVAVTVTDTRVRCLSCRGVN